MLFGAAAFHAAAPAFFRTSGTSYVPPAMSDGSVGGVTVATNPASALIGSGLLGGNHATPSFTSAKRSRYEPGVAGAVTVALTVRDAVGSTAAPSGVRGPSHRTVAPCAADRWK